MASPVSQLADLFIALFNDHELRRFLSEQGVGDSVPGPGVSLSSLAKGGADALERANLVNAQLFSALRVERPRQEERIQRVRQAFDAVATSTVATTHSNPSSPSRSNDPWVILLLASNPFNTARLAIDEEVRAIDQRLNSSEHRDRFSLKAGWAVRPREILDAVERYKPTLVHFSSHGAPDGLVLSGAGNGETPVRVPADALAEFFELYADSIRCVLVNACHSEDQAKAIAQYIDAVIGTRGKLDDESALVFSSTFYRTLGAGRDVGFAFKAAKSTVRLEGLPGADQFVLFTRPGTDAASIKLL